ncbi:MAG: sigma-70 family RNA polymerase sigma factor [Lachnospiraceae bacterium]|nr:sigma-70 family RNA polymerase sigma factor [Lachnospiraceae bacterium]
MKNKRDREHEPESEWWKEREQEQFMISLYENYRDYMFYVARQFVEDVHACEDIVQDGIVKLLRRVELLQSLEEKALITYLYKTIKNLALDYLDERMKERATPPEDMEGALGRPAEPGAAEQAANPEEMMAAAADSERIRRAWEGLTEEERFLLAHKYYYCESGEELARATGIRRDFISMKLIRAKKKLAKLLQEDDEKRKEAR